MSALHIDIPADRIAAFCRRHGIRELRLFGSVLRDDFRHDSDVDFLVEFEPGAAVGLLGLAQMELELGDLVGRKADLRTAGELSRYFRQDVLRHAALLYAA
ncbi:MAG TPA: nucleotidyltransferase domain-containing protein [Longimicrobium sp.]